MVAPESAVVTVCSVGGGALVVVTTSPPEIGSKSVVVVLVGETLCVVLVGEVNQLTFQTGNKINGTLIFDWSPISTLLVVHSCYKLCYNTI